jgi:hypothetical protein
MHAESGRRARKWRLTERFVPPLARMSRSRQSEKAHEVAPN